MLGDADTDSLGLNPDAGDEAKDTPPKDPGKEPPKDDEPDDGNDTFEPEPKPAPVEKPPPVEDDAEDDEPPADEDHEIADLKGKLPAKEFRRVKKYREERREAREEAERAKAEVEVAKAEREALRAENETFKWEKANPEPDPVEDPEVYKAWAKEKATREAGVQKAAKEKPAPPERTPLDTMREAVMAENPDFNRFVSKAVLHRIETDPALHDRVWTAKNPPLEAYKVGRELILGKDAAKPRLSDSGSGFAPERGGNKKVTELLPEQRKIARSFGITDKQMLDDLNRKAGAQG